MRTRERLSRLRSGMIVPLMVILLLLLSVSGMTVVQIGHAARLRSIQTSSDIAARYAADAGVERTLYLMNRMQSEGLWNANGIPVFNKEILSGDNAYYTVSISDSPYGGYALTSVGRSGQAERTVRVHAILTSPLALNFAILSRGNINLDNSAFVGGFDSSDSSLKNLSGDVGTLSIGNGAVRLRNSVTVRGDIYVGPNGDPTKVISRGSSVTITGSVLNHASVPPLPAVSAPSLPSRGNLSIGNSGTVTLTNHQGQYGKIDIGNSGTLRIQGHCVLAVTTLDLGNSAAVNIENGGSLTLYLAGDLKAKNSASINNQTRIPSNFKLYGSANPQSIDLINSSSFYGVIYAPNASMTVHNSVSAYGTFIVADYDLKNSGKIYYDKALRHVEATDPLAQLIIVRWEDL